MKALVLALLLCGCTNPRVASFHAEPERRVWGGMTEPEFKAFLSKLSPEQLDDFGKELDEEWKEMQAQHAIDAQRDIARAVDDLASDLRFRSLR